MDTLLVDRAAVLACDCMSRDIPVVWMLRCAHSDLHDLPITDDVTRLQQHPNALSLFISNMAYVVSNFTGWYRRAD